MTDVPFTETVQPQGLCYHVRRATRSSNQDDFRGEIWLRLAGLDKRFRSRIEPTSGRRPRIRAMHRTPCNRLPHHVSFCVCSGPPPGP